MYNECKIQKFGDYYVRVEDLMTNPEAKTLIVPQKALAISKIVNDLKAMGAGNPIIFYPSVETKEDRKANSSNQRTTVEEEVRVVINDDGGGGGYTNDAYPGYTFNTEGQLQYSQQITEEFAWNNDVWVIGEEENCDEGNMIAAPEDFSLNPDPVARFQGQSERGGIIQCTNLNAIEHWISGKLEFKFTVLNSSGTIILGPMQLGKVKRKYFKDQRWYDYNRFIGNWNISTFGNWMTEHWIEEDGGISNPVTLTLPPPPGTPGATLSISIPAKDRDDDLGVATIQFTDLISQIYSITYANIKRKN